MSQFSIAIDGPAGAGKSTIAKQLAKRLQCTYIDTGAMYRAVGLYCINHDIDYCDEQAVNACLGNITIRLAYINNMQMIYLNDEDVSEAIRTQEVAATASKVATYSKVREALVEMQRQLAKTQCVVMDGRDIGTVVLPEATLKVFLTASAEERAKRRCLEYKEKGLPDTFDKILEEIKARDYQDANRSVSPLKRADDAEGIDSTELCIDEIVEHIYQLLTSRKTGDE